MELLILFPLLILVVYCVVFAFMKQKHEKTSYYKNTGKSLYQIWRNTGDRGEYSVYFSLEVFEQYGAKFLFNCYLPLGNGKTTEIDLIMIDSSGIYVFESKNYGGWIFGSENQKYWTQTLPARRGSQKHQFYNPIFQNKLHVSCLQNCLNQSIPIYSVVVFSDRCTFKDVKVSPEQCVVYCSEVANVIYEWKKIGQNALSEEQIKQLYDKLYPYTQNTEYIKQQHIDSFSGYNEYDFHNVDYNVQKTNMGNESKNGMKLYPLCGAFLTLRIAKQGQSKGTSFYGCSAFPNCRYTEKLDNKK